MYVEMLSPSFLARELKESRWTGGVIMLSQVGVVKYFHSCDNIPISSSFQSICTKDVLVFLNITAPQAASRVALRFPLSTTSITMNYSSNRTV